MTPTPDTPGSELPDLEPDHQPTQVRSGPPKRFLLFALPALIGFGLAAFFILSPTDGGEPAEEAQSLIAPETAAPDAGIEAESPGESNDPVHLARIPELEKRLMMLARTLQGQAEQIAGNRQDLETLDASVSQAASSAAIGIEEKIRALESRMTSQAAALDSRVAAIEKARSRKAKQQKKTAQAPALPFTLLSVDYWDNRPYAVLNDEGGLRHLSPGETLSQWTLDSLTSGQAVFRYSSGETRALKLEGKI